MAGQLQQMILFEMVNGLLGPVPPGLTPNQQGSGISDTPQDR
jgi:hypothetical protein